MSFTDKFVGLMAKPGDDTSVPDGTPWYIKYGIRILGIVAAFFAILFGLYDCLGIIALNVRCLISGVIEMLLGFVVMAIEAPFCCMFIEHAKTISEKADQRPLWNRAALYCGFSIIPVIICFGLGSLFGCGLIFATGAAYGMLSLGKKASRQDMLNAAANQQPQQNNSVPTTNDRAGIINNAQPFSFSGPIGTDSNV